MSEPYAAKPSLGESVAFPLKSSCGISIRLIFATEPNQEAPILIRELLRNSYLNRLSSEGRCEQ